MKIWNGSAFVDPSGYKIWNGSAYVDPKEINIWDGSAFQKVWPTGFARQRMVKGGNWSSGSNFNFLTVTGWVTDATYPSTVTSHKLAVAGSGTAVIRAYLDSQTDDAARSDAVYLMHNDATLATGSLTNYQNRTFLDITVSGVVIAPGDLIWVQTKTGSAIQAKVYAGSYVEAVAASSIPAQRMNKNGNTSAGSSRAIMANWSSDATYPGTITSNKLIVQGTGSATINAQAVGVGGGGNTSYVYLMHNGIQIATYSAYGNAYSAPVWSIPRTVVQGDEIWLEAQAGSFATLSINTGAYIEVVPI